MQYCIVLERAFIKLQIIIYLPYLCSKHSLWVLVITTSMWRFQRISTIYMFFFWAKNKQNNVYPYKAHFSVYIFREGFSSLLIGLLIWWWIEGEYTCTRHWEGERTGKLRLLTVHVRKTFSSRKHSCQGRKSCRRRH